jgi:broad specificity phosphatase PhoE
MQLYIIRHAQSTNNALVDEWDRDCDPTLTELGQRQADILARHLADGAELEPPSNPANPEARRGYRFTHLYCSPMWRALQTAHPIGEALGLAPEVWTEIHEQGGIYLDHRDGRGPVGYPGKTRQQIQAAFPHYLLPETITAHGWWNQSYEDWPTCHGRAIRVAAELRKRAAGDERIAMISHGGFMDALLKAFFHQLPDRRLFYYHYNTSITRIDFRGDGRLDFCYLNRLSHLPPELVS